MKMPVIIVWTDLKITWEPLDNISASNLVDSFFRRCLKRLNLLKAHFKTSEKEEKNQRFIDVIRNLNQKKKETIAAENQSAAGSDKTYVIPATVPKTKRQPQARVGDHLLDLSDLSFKDELKTFQTKQGNRQLHKSKQSVFINSEYKRIVSFKAYTTNGNLENDISLDLNKCFLVPGTLCEELAIALSLDHSSNIEIAHKSLSALTIIDACDDFTDCTRKLTSKNMAMCVLDEANFYNFFIILPNNHDYTDYDLLFKYYLLKMPANDLLHISFANSVHDFLQSEALSWYEDRPDFQHLVFESTFLYSDSSLLSAGDQFCFFGCLDSPVDKLLVTHLQSLGKKLVPVGHKTPSFVVISSYIFQYIHTIPQFRSLLNTAATFYLFRQNSKETDNSTYNLYEIYKKSALITMSLNFIQSFDPNAFYEHFKNTNGRVQIKIPSKLFKEFKSRVNTLMERGTQDSKIIGKVYKLFKESVEDHDCLDIVEYLQCLEKKHFRTFRYFYILDDETSGAQVLSFSEFCDTVYSSGICN